MEDDYLNNQAKKSASQIRALHATTMEDEPMDTGDSNSQQYQVNGGQRQYGASKTLPESDNQHQSKDYAQHPLPSSMGHQNKQPCNLSNVASQEQKGGALDSRHAHSQEPEQLQATQLTVQQYRSLQASKQMVYDVYSQTIAMLEEFEDFDDPDNKEVLQKDEGSTKSIGAVGQSSNKGKGAKQGKVTDEKRSQIKRPDQSHKKKYDVQAIVEAELVCLQAQLRFCPKDVREQTRDELVEKTLGWVAVREEMGVRRGLTDSYASQVLEILLTGETKLKVQSERKKRTGPVGEEAVMSSVRALQMGQHYGAEQDKQFHEDPNKAAKCPKIRSASRQLSKEQSARRVIEMNSRLGEHLKSYMYNLC